MVRLLVTLWHVSQQVVQNMDPAVRGTLSMFGSGAEGFQNSWQAAFHADSSLKSLAGMSSVLTVSRQMFLDGTSYLHKARRLMTMFHGIIRRSDCTRCHTMLLRAMVP